VHQTFAIDNGFGEVDAQLVIVVEMRKRLVAVAQRRESVIAPRHWPVFHAQLRQAPNQLTA
jgi:hypothetical protein